MRSICQYCCYYKRQEKQDIPHVCLLLQFVNGIEEKIFFFFVVVVVFKDGDQNKRFYVFDFTCNISYMNYFNKLHDDNHYIDITVGKYDFYDFAQIFDRFQTETLKFVSIKAF